VWKLTLTLYPANPAITVSEGLNSVETFYSFITTVWHTLFQKDLIVWKPVLVWVIHALLHGFQKDLIVWKPLKKVLMKQKTR